MCVLSRVTFTELKYLSNINYLFYMRHVLIKTSVWTLYSLPRIDLEREKTYVTIVTEITRIRLSGYHIIYYAFDVALGSDFHTRVCSHNAFSSVTSPMKRLRINISQTLRSFIRSIVDAASKNQLN